MPQKIIISWWVGGKGDFMFLLIEGANDHDIALFRNRAALISYLQARLIAGVDIDSEIDVFPIDVGSRIETSTGIAIKD